MPVNMRQIHFVNFPDLPGDIQSTLDNNARWANSVSLSGDGTARKAAVLV